MNRGVSQAAGYTIVEALIFFAVTGLLFVMVAALVSGQQSRTQFDQAVREAHQRVDDVMNDLSTGLYNVKGSVNCSIGPANTLLITESAANRQGANPDCLFIGRVMQFVPAGAPTDVVVYTVAGRSKPIGVPGGGSPTALRKAGPVVIARAASNNGALKADAQSFPDVFGTVNLPYGLTPDAMYYLDAAGQRHDIGWVAFVNSLESSTGAALNNSANLPVSIYVQVPPGGGNGFNATTADAAVDINTALNSPTVVRNPPGGVVVCFNDFSGRNQHASIVIGADQSFSSDLIYDRGSC